MHVAVFGSGAGTTLREVLAAQKKIQKPLFEIRLLYTDRVCNFQKIAEEEKIPLIYNPWDASIPREEYDRRGLEKLFGFSKEHRPIDLLLLAGYMRLMSFVWIDAFRGRILNTHPADLTILDAEGRRKFIGASAVYKALQAGERRTRTSAILIDETVDGGPVLVTGPWVDYTEGFPITEERVATHQEKQKALSDWPACLTALQLISEGRVALRSSPREILLDGKPLPPWGYNLK